MIRIRNLSRSKRPYLVLPLWTALLICLNVLLFIINATNHDGLQRTISNYGLLVEKDMLPESYFALLSYSLFHANVFHLFSNMVGLAYFGSTIERSVGFVKFFGIYFLSSVSSALFFVGAEMMVGASHMILVGSSGAVCGLVGAAIAQRNKVAYCWLVAEVIFMLAGHIAAFPVAFEAHIGGILTGFAFVKVMNFLQSMKIGAKPQGLLGQPQSLPRTL